MAAAAELDAVAELDHSHPVAVLLAEEGDCAHLLCLLHSGVAHLFKGEILADEGVDLVLYVADLLVGELLEVAEVEAEVTVRNV